MGHQSKLQLFGVLLVCFCLSTVIAAVRQADDEQALGTFFQVEEDSFDLLFYLTAEDPPQIKKVVCASGNQPQTIVSEGGEFDVAPDGKRLVYSYQGRLYLIRTDTTKGKPTWTRGDGGRPKWSANGRLISFIAPAAKGEAIAVMDHLGEEVDTLLKVDGVVNYFWESSSESLLAVVKRKASFYLVRVFLNGDKDIIYQFPKTVAVIDCSLSPDDSELAYISRNNKTTEQAVFLVDMHIYRLFRLTRPYKECRGLSWSPDAKSLIFSADKALYTVRGGQGNVFRLQRNALEPVWSRNSSKIAYLKGNQPAAVSLYDIQNDYIQDLSLSAKPKSNLILLRQQKSLADIRVEKIKGNSISYSLSKDIEREQVLEGMLLPLHSSVVTDSFTSAEFVMGEEVAIQVSPLTELKINEESEDGYFEELNQEREVSIRVLSGQITVLENNQETIIQAGEEYVVRLAKLSSLDQTEQQQSQIPSSLLLGLEAKVKESTSSTESKAAAEGSATWDSQNAEEQINHPHDEDALGSDCLTCHPSEPDWKQVDYQTVEFTTEAAAGCIKCHRGGFETEKVVANRHGFLDDPKRCLDCHREKPIKGVDNHQTVSFVNTIITLCTNCHTDDIGASHPVGMVPKIKKYISNVKTPDSIRVMDIPPDLHLDENGLMTCVTCHVVHGDWRDSQKPYKKSEPLGEIFGQPFYQTYFLRRNNYNSGLCAACHGQSDY